MRTRLQIQIQGVFFKNSLIGTRRNAISFVFSSPQPPMPAFSNYSVMMNDHAAHPWIGTHAACAQPGQFEGPMHKKFVRYHEESLSLQRSSSRWPIPKNSSVNW